MQKQLRQLLAETFGYETYSEVREKLRDAKYPYPIDLSWRSIARGRKRNGRCCIMNERLKEDPDVDTSYVSEYITYIRFKGEDIIHRFKNPPEMVASLREFDEFGQTDLEEGDRFVLEPMNKARSPEYSRSRREAIKDGSWEVKPRGPNVNIRRPIKPHLRPF